MNTKGVRYCFKKFVTVMMAVCMTCAVSPWATRTGYFVYADTPDAIAGLGVLDGSTFKVQTEISDWSQLEPLLDATYGIDTIEIDGANGGAITTADLSEFIKLGKDAGATTVPPVITDESVTYPTKVLPDYDSTADEGEHFEKGLKARANTDHSIPTSFEWSGTLTFVYPMAGETETDPDDRVVKVKHGVTASVDGTSQSMLELSDVDDSDVEVLGATYEGDNLLLDLYEGKYEGLVAYHAALRYIDYNDEDQAVDLEYFYTLAQRNLTTVAAPGTEEILGALRVKAVKNSAAQAGVKFEVYTDAQCTQAAKKFDAASGEWVLVGTLETGADGWAEVQNVKAGTYYVKRVADGEVKAVELAKSDKAVVLSGGEGTSAKVNKASVLLSPDWAANANNSMGFTDIDSAENADVKAAAAYGGDLFVRSGGTAIAATAEGLTELGGCMVYVDREGGADETLEAGEEQTALEAAVEYINGTLLGIAPAAPSGEMSRLYGTSALIDGESGHGHIKMEQKYLDEELLAELQFVDEDAPIVPPIWGPVVEPVVDEPVVGPVEEEPVVEPVVEEDDKDSVKSVDGAKDRKSDVGVRTADDTNIVMWTTMLIAGILALLLMLFRRKIL